MILLMKMCIWILFNNATQFSALNITLFTSCLFLNTFFLMMIYYAVYVEIFQIH